jgi:hypothetical protein
MRRFVNIFILAISIVLVGICASLYPDALSDRGNRFLSGFVNHELLSFLGVVVTITLASVANLHLELNKLESASGKRFPKTRKSIRLSAYSLIGGLVFGFLIVATKPLIGDGVYVLAIWNSAAIIVIIFNILVLVDLTQATLSLPPT